MTARWETGGVEERIARDFTDSTGDGRTLVGYGAVWNSPTLIREGGVQFHERIAPGAFAGSLSRRMPQMMFNHGRDSRIGALPIGQVTVAREDTRGLYVEARLFTSEAAESVREAIQAGAITGQSFAFRVTDESWEDSNGRPVATDDVMNRLYRGVDLMRTLRAVDLREVGPVTTPAYEATSVGVRSVQHQGMSPGLRASYLRALVLRSLT
jgi:HK97 family phage prohead protease